MGQSTYVPNAGEQRRYYATAATRRQVLEKDMPTVYGSVARNARKLNGNSTNTIVGRLRPADAYIV